MPLSVLLRLLEQRLDEGELTGEVEIVETGARGRVRSVEELIQFLRTGTLGSPETTEETQ